MVPPATATGAQQLLFLGDRQAISIDEFEQQVAGLARALYTFL